MSIPPRLQQRLTTRVKLLAEMDTAEKTLPQEGHFSVKLNDEKLDFGITSLPTDYGENIVLRLLNTTRSEADLDQETSEQRVNHVDSLRE